MVDAHRLRTFLSVMASGSVNAAAGHLGYSPSAVSQQIAALQKETGLTLFTRHGRGIEPTPAAHTLAAESEQLMTELKRVCLLYTSPSPRDRQKSRMPSSA